MAHCRGARPVLVVGHSCVLSWWEVVKGEPAPHQWSRYAAEVGRGLRAADLVSRADGGDAGLRWSGTMVRFPSAG